MKYDLTFKVMGHFLFHATSPSLTSSERSAVFSEYRKIISRSKEIGNPNPLSSAYALGAWFIAMNRSDSHSVEENCEIMAHALQNSRLLRIAMGDADHYLDPKRIQKQKKWAESTHCKTFENDWVVDLLPGNGSFDLGYDYLECGICKLCRDEGCPEYAKYLCRLDYLLADIMGLNLVRTSTLADGGSMCDFRFSRK